MENATKALFIAAGVLMGMMILSLGVALYYSLQGYISDTQDTMEQNANNQFNTRFLNYINMQPDSSGTYRIDFKLRVQDIITAANISYQNNIQLTPDIFTETEAEYENLMNENNLYVTVNATLYYKDASGNERGDVITHLERNINEKASEWLSKYTSNYQYKCYSADVKISEITGRVYEITFK